MLCSSCKDKPFCSTPCKKLNNYLKKHGIYSADWIRPQTPRSLKKHYKRIGEKENVKWREVPFSALPIKWQVKKGLIDEN